MPGPARCLNVRPVRRATVSFRIQTGLRDLIHGLTKGRQRKPRKWKLGSASRCLSITFPLPAAPPVPVIPAISRGPPGPGFDPRDVRVPWIDGVPTFIEIDSIGTALTSFDTASAFSKPNLPRGLNSTRFSFSAIFKARSHGAASRPHTTGFFHAGSDLERSRAGTTSRPGHLSLLRMLI